MQVVLDSYLICYSHLYWKILCVLQELKLQGTKVRDCVVLSRYSWNKLFANNLSIFLADGHLAL